MNRLLESRQKQIETQEMQLKAIKEKNMSLQQQLEVLKLKVSPRKFIVFIVYEKSIIYGTLLLIFSSAAPHLNINFFILKVQAGDAKSGIEAQLGSVVKERDQLRTELLNGKMEANSNIKKV